VINVGDREVLLKDEGQNPTGSHKDRLAWEIIVFYKQMITTRLLSDEIEQDLPSLSMISSGSAAVAVQTMLHHYGLPPLRVIVDSSMRPSVVEHLKRLGCLVYPVSLSDEQLSDEDVKAITDNKEGLDITSRTTADSALTKYYDWLTYEILNQHPRWIFVPVGTGDLYGNIARIIFDSLTAEDDISDGRLKASKNDLLRIGLVGATTDRSDSILDKLYAPFGPELKRVREYMDDRRSFFAPESGIFEVSDDSVREAQGYASANSITVTEPSGIAGLGLYLEEYVNVVDDRDSILVVNTGRLYIPSDAEEPQAGVAPVGIGLGGNATRKWGRIRGRAGL
jgi:threonine dehydratase